MEVAKRLLQDARMAIASSTKPGEQVKSRGPWHRAEKALDAGRDTLEAYPGVVGPALAAVAQEQIVTGNMGTGALLLRLLCAVERLGALEPEPGTFVH